MIPKRCILPVFIPHLGCPHDCVFCNQKKISGQLVPADAGTVRTAIEEAPENSDGYELAFYGGSFTAIPIEKQTELLEAAAPYRKNGRINAVRLSTRPDCVSENELEFLLKYGVETIELGVQSLDSEVLMLSGRGHTVKDCIEAAKRVKNYGFKLVLQMMTGLPGDTNERSIKTAKAIAELHPDGVRVYPTVVIKDTELYRLWKENNYKPQSVDDAVDLGAKLLCIFEKAGIPVIRFGLNPSEDLSSGEAAAGAYHPALGQLVRSRLFLERLDKLISDISPSTEAVLGVHPSEMSDAIGQHRCNIKSLQNKFNLKNISVKPADVPKGDIRVLEYK